MTQASSAVRAKRKNYERHWNTTRSETAHSIAFFRVAPPKSAKRTAKKARMAKLYRDWFEDIRFGRVPTNQLASIQLWLRPGLNKRRFRNTVLGSEAS